MEVDYKNLYKLQDEVMNIVFNVENGFYLTGGTCLSRFYFQKRYSDDLDFFASDLARFHFAVKNIENSLNLSFEVRTEVDSRDFKRFKINDILQLDFINDRVFRYGDLIQTKEGFLIDNLDNILSNKINAIISRDEAKDIFDMFLIHKFHKFSWENILKIAHKKAFFEDLDLIVRLKTFPKIHLKSIKLIDKSFLDDYDENYINIINEIYKIIGNL